MVNSYLKEQTWRKSGKYFKIIVLEALNKHVPLKQIKKNPDPEFYTRGIRNLKKKARLAYNNRNKSPEHLKSFKDISKMLEKEKKEAQENFLGNILHEGENNNWRTFYSYVRRRRGDKELIAVLQDRDKQIVDDKEKAEFLNSYFISVFNLDGEKCDIVQGTHSDSSFKVTLKMVRERITKLKNHKSRGPDEIPTEILKLGGEAMIPYIIRLINISINNATLPHDWKSAIVVPIYKSGDKTKVENYRPISLTSVVCKVMEHIIAKYIRDFLTTNDWFHEGQHGFREGFSCDSQMISLFQDLADEVDKGGRIDAAVIDFSKAFDLVPHGKLLDKIIRLGIDHRVVLWIKAFLEGRTQKVRVGKETSRAELVKSGVPQGSVLGPLLFLIYINDLCKNIKSKVRLFADDCIIYKIIRDIRDTEIIQSDLDKIVSWATLNGMKINDTKSKSITFCRKKQEIRLNYKIGGATVPQEDCCKYLGVYLKSNLTWDSQIDQVSGKAWRALHFVMRNLKKANPKTKEVAYMTLVRPLMEYGAGCWDPYRTQQINSLERLQRRAAKFVKGKRDHGEELVIELGWEKLETRRKQARLCSLYRAYIGQKAWGDITARLEKPTYYGRNDHEYKIKTIRQRTDVGKFSFLNRTINDWNKLPAGVFMTCPSLGSFKRKIKCVT